MKNQSNNYISNITITMVFDGSALNRDEKIGGNIQSIKKLTFKNEVVSFISRPAIRHYLFNTLIRSAGWKPAKITGQGTVAQFDLLQDDIISSAELDAFGYMYTISGENSITRKAPFGITKAISLLPYNQDMAFYANHDLIQRGNKDGLNLTPNPFQREEHSSLYKLSVTIDSKILGEDVWIINEKPREDTNKNELVIELQKPQKVELKNVKKIEKENEFYYQIDEKEIRIEENTITIDEDLVEITKKDKKSDQEVLKFKKKFLNVNDKDKEKDDSGQEDKKNKKKENTFIIEDFEENEEDKTFTFTVTRTPIYDEGNEILTIESGKVKILEFIGKSVIKDSSNIEIGNKYQLEKGCVEIYENSGRFKIIFKLDDNEKKQRIRNLLEVIHNGLIAHSSGEDNTIIPLFMIAAPVKVPSPIFHPYIDIDLEDNKIKIIGIEDCLKNSWISGSIFIKDSERIKVEREDENILRDWNKFLETLGLKS